MLDPRRRTTSQTPCVLCFGEMLWDILPTGAFPGGAPFNVAYHLAQHGADVHLVSAVGRDILGDELLHRLAAWHVSMRAVARLARFPTGVVRVSLAPNGDARFAIETKVAWDHIPATAEMLRTAVCADALVFGSLAQRSAANRVSLSRLLATLPKKALRVFDVNLRPPHDDLTLVRKLARRATVLKLNSDEAARLAGATPRANHEEAHARALAADTGCAIVVVTAGARGAGLLRGRRWHWEPARPVRVADTVGAGDAFLAALVAHVLAGNLSDAACLARACRIGEWIATQRGATPPYKSRLQLTL